MSEKQTNVKIQENWQEIEKIEQLVAEKTGDPSARFNASTFFLSGERHLMIPCMYRKKKGSSFSQSFKEMMVVAKFCPFTGKPLYEDSITQNKG
jgi:hypothetical protein